MWKGGPEIGDWETAKSCVNSGWPAAPQDPSSVLRPDFKGRRVPARGRAGSVSALFPEGGLVSTGAGAQTADVHEDACGRGRGDEPGRRSSERVGPISAPRPTGGREALSAVGGQWRPLR